MNNKKRIYKWIKVVSAIVIVLTLIRIGQVQYRYAQGKHEYEEIQNAVVIETEPEDDAKEDKEEDEEEPEPVFKVDFEKLLEINPDTVGWIRFDPEPSMINYPIVKTDNNDTYLSKTFSDNSNSVGAIFVNCYNNGDFNDRNTIIYGHRMKDHTMFHDLELYQDEQFWKDNPNIYIYTPDGRKITYEIYSAGIVKDVSKSYLTVFNNDDGFQQFIDWSTTIGTYQTGVTIDLQSQVITLSTCTAASNDDRMVVHAVKIGEEIQ